MIKLFVTDLDGCISYPYRTPNWEAIQEIRDLNIASRSIPEIPPLTICTGRPHPYAEAVAQWLDVRLPLDRKSTRLNSSHVAISYAVFCLKKKIKNDIIT